MHLTLHHEQVHPPQLPKNLLQSWITHVIHDFNKEGGDISFIFCSDPYLLEINKLYLKRDYLTDIITFDYSDDKMITGDLFISTDRIKDNALLFNVLFEEELLRVIVHGILHLLGLNDQSAEDKKAMRKQEDKYIQLYLKMSEKNEL